jgi:type IV pilus assembly protein PilB
VRHKIGEHLVRLGIITGAQLDAALAERRRSGERLGSVLARMKLATEAQVAGALAAQLGYPLVDLVEHLPDIAASAAIPKNVALEHACVGISREGDVLTVAMADPLRFSVVHDIELQTNCRVVPVLATRSEILAAIERAYDGGGALSQPPRKEVGVPRRTAASDVTAGERVESGDGDTPVETLVSVVLERASASGATDVHVEPSRDAVVIRHRIDGVLHHSMRLSPAVHEELVARLKILAGMDVTEKRLPQDGRIRSRAADGTDVVYVASTLRTLHGEKFVLRLLEEPRAVPALSDLGLSAAALDAVRQLVQHKRGLLLVAGPPASGQTTFVAAMLQALRSESIDIVSIEDPSEYLVDGVVQVQTDEPLGLTFARALGAALDQGPDVVAMSSLHEPEVTRLAIEAARSKCLVVGTWTAGDAASAVASLREAASDAYAYSAALVGVVAGRLVRRLCVSCRRVDPDSDTALEPMRGTPEQEGGDGRLYLPVGCEQCHYTGYTGRTGIYEVMPIDAAVRRLIADGASAADIRSAAIEAGMITIAEHGVWKASRGVTSIAELRRVVGEARILCPECGTTIAADFTACPRCAVRLGPSCPHCSRALQPGWNCCPYCARSLGVGGRGASVSS